MPPNDLHAAAFPKLDDRHMSALEHCAKTILKRYRRGEKLFCVGDREFRFFVIKTGEVEIVDESDDTPKTIAVLGAREFTGEVTQLTGGPALVSGVARTDCEAYEVSKEAPASGIKQTPELEFRD
jgi:thioredoxin reductase (NADPH)